MRMSMSRIWKCLLIFALGFTGIPQSANAERPGTYSAFYVIGDSLSDTGNDLMLTGGLVPPPNTYFEGRFSNGPIAFEYLWQALQSDSEAQLKPSESVSNLPGETAVSLAYGGSGSGMNNYTPGGFPVPGARGQVDELVQQFGNKLPRKALYAIWTGPNDYLLGLVNTPAAVIKNIRQSILKLYSHGARNILVPNLPDLGSVPILVDPAFSFPPESSHKLTALTLAHNAALSGVLRTIRRQYPQINLIEVDIFTFFEQLRTWFPNTGAGPGGNCLFINPGLCPGVPSFEADGYLFWDVQHPSTEAHRLMGSHMLEKLVRQ
jgi:phospholipase/lecithinase/hemolysin